MNQVVGNLTQKFSEGQGMSLSERFCWVKLHLIGQISISTYHTQHAAKEAMPPGASDPIPLHCQLTLSIVIINVNRSEGIKKLFDYHSSFNLDKGCDSGHCVALLDI